MTTTKGDWITDDGSWGTGTLADMLRDPGATGGHREQPESGSGVRIVTDPAIIQATRDIVQAALRQDPSLCWIVDPFSPAERRYDIFVRMMQQEIGRQRASMRGPLANVPSGRDELLALYAAAIGWGPAQAYLDDPRVNEVKICGCQILVQETGKPPIRARETFADTADVVQRAMLLAGLSGVPLDARTPQQTIPVGTGTRVHASIPPLVRDGALIVIRRGRTHPWTIDDLLAAGSITDDTAALLRLIVQARPSFLVAGVTGSGKTTVLESMVNTLGDLAGTDSPHVVCIEDNAQELVIRTDRLSVTAMQTTDPVQYDDVMRQALRQTPGLVVAGEIRGKEAASLIGMMQTGHPCATTIHANSTEHAILRLANLAAMPGAMMYGGRFADAVRDAVDQLSIIILTRQDELTRRRYVAEIGVVDGIEEYHGSIMPKVVPIVKAWIENGRLQTTQSVVVRDGQFVAADSKMPLPNRLATIQRSIRGWSRMQTAHLSQEGAVHSIQAAQLVMDSQPARAASILAEAWQSYRDERLIPVARILLDRYPEAVYAATGAPEPIVQRIEALIRDREWEAANTVYRSDAYHRVFVMALGSTEYGSWSTVEQMIQDGIHAIHHAWKAIEAATTLMNEGKILAAERALHDVAEPLLPASLLDQVRKVRARLLRMQGADDAAALIEQRRTGKEERS